MNLKHVYVVIISSEAGLLMSFTFCYHSGMGHSMTGEHFPVLQLQKWSPSLTQLSLSEFREAFMSPSRELLLLLSYECEALMLPLFSGNNYLFVCACLLARLPFYSSPNFEHFYFVDALLIYLSLAIA